MHHERGRDVRQPRAVRPGLHNAPLHRQDRHTGCRYLVSEDRRIRLSAAAVLRCSLHTPEGHRKGEDPHVRRADQRGHQHFPQLGIHIRQPWIPGDGCAGCRNRDRMCRRSERPVPPGRLSDHKVPLHLQDPRPLQVGGVQGEGILLKVLPHDHQRGLPGNRQHDDQHGTRTADRADDSRPCRIQDP